MRSTQCGTGLVSTFFWVLVCVLCFVCVCVVARGQRQVHAARRTHNKEDRHTHEQRRRLDADRGVEAPKVGVALQRAAGGARLALARGAHGAYAPRWLFLRLFVLCVV
jgi:hypothetical protein